MSQLDIFTYCAMKKPEQMLRFLRNYSRIEVDNPQQLADNLREVYRNLTNEEKEPFLLKLSKIHPDHELLSVSEDIEEGSNYCTCPSCSQHRHFNNEISRSEVIGTHVGANGLNAVGHYMSGAMPESVKASGDSSKDDVKDIKTENMVKNMFNDKIFKYLVSGAILFLIWKSVKK